MVQQETVEHEVKLGVWPGFVLPDLRGALDGAATDAPQQRRLEAVYFDTPDLRLLRRGVTLRFRRGEEPRELWTAKLPEPGPKVGLSRREISVPAAGTNMPTMLADLVRGWALGAPLEPVARLRTVRTRTTLRRSDGKPLAMVDDDEVSILKRSRVAARFRELELELADGAPHKLLTRLAGRMVQAGAQPVDQMPKVVRVLGPMALAPWELAPPQLPAHPTAADLITAGLIASAARLVDHIAIVVLDEDIEGIHQARVGIRRLRSDLRTARPLLDWDVVGLLRRELRWLMQQFGDVRDLDVLIGRLRGDVESLNEADHAGASAVLSEASGQRAAAYDRLRSALRTPRCAALLEEAARVAAEPPFTRRAARRPASDVVPQLVQKPLRNLHREAKKQGDEPDDEWLHRLRIAVKRVRYAAELAAPAAGKKARRAARGMASVQDLLGDHHDACTAIVQLHALGARTGPSGAWTAGLLGGLQLEHAADCRKRLPPTWAKATAPKRWRWAK